MAVKVKPWKGAWWLFIDHNGHRKAKKVGSKKAAEIAKAQIEARLALGGSLVDDRMVPAFRDAAERWLTGHGRLGQICESTEAAYRAHLQRYVFPRLGDAPVTHITRAEVRALFIDLMGQGASRSLGKNILAPVRQTFEQLIEDGVLTANPAARIGKYLKDTRGAPATIECLTPDEERLLLEAARVHCPRYYCVFLCALRTGLRIGELCGLQWGDLDIKGRFIEVRRQVRDGTVIPTLKNRRIRRVDMSDQLAEALTGLLVDRKRETLRMGWGRVPEWVFCNEAGRPLWKSTFERRVFHRLMQTAGLPRRRFHALRHTFASRLLQNRESPAYVKEQMGHSSIQVTVDIYGHLMPGANRAAVNRLDQAAHAGS